MLDWQRSKAIELEWCPRISSVGIITLAASAVKCLTCHSLHVNVERVLCVSSEKGQICLVISAPQKIVEL